MTNIAIVLSSELTGEDRTILHRYLDEALSFSGTEWRRSREAIGRLAKSTIRFSARWYRFDQFYRLFIDNTYAHPFLNHILETPDLEQAGPRLQADISRKIQAWLRINGIWPGVVPGAEYLVIFCLYRWAAFARGYLFEVAVLRDLEESGLHVAVHNLTGVERYARFDLHITNLGNGDVKASTYFLDDFIAVEPDAAFYITRLYDTERRQSRQVVFLTLQAWSRIDGGTISATVRAAPRHFPAAVKVQVGWRTWIVVAYEVWKERLRHLQDRRK